MSVTKIIQNAIELPFNDSSRLVLMSDCHRSDGSASDNFIHNRNVALTALKYYYNNGFTYFELGDGDELWENKSFDSIAATNKEVFAVLLKFLKSGRLYLIYGNHDIVKKNNPYLYEGFPRLTFHEGLVLRHEETGNKILLLHGHQVDFFNSRLWLFSRFLVRYIWKPLELIGVNDPTSPASNPGKKSAVDQKLHVTAQKNKCMIIAGHTHKAVFPQPGESMYFNDGCCVLPYMISAIEIFKGMISLVSWSVKARPDGVLYAGRDYLAGPQKISAYFRYKSLI